MMVDKIENNLTVMKKKWTKPTLSDFKINYTNSGTTVGYDLDGMS
jgi:hypothetical protein